jgi:hypothetical protein
LLCIIPYTMQREKNAHSSNDLLRDNGNLSLITIKNGFMLPPESFIDNNDVLHYSHNGVMYDIHVGLIDQMDYSHRIGDRIKYKLPNSDDYINGYYLCHDYTKVHICTNCKSDEYCIQYIDIDVEIFTDSHLDDDNLYSNSMINIYRYYMTDIELECMDGIIINSHKMILRKNCKTIGSIIDKMEGEERIKLEFDSLLVNMVIDSLYSFDFLECFLTHDGIVELYGIFDYLGCEYALSYFIKNHEYIPAKYKRIMVVKFESFRRIIH